MTLIDTLKQKSKKLAVGVALGGALLGAGCSKENTEEIKDDKAKMEQRADWKTEIKDARKKVSYLDEYLAAVEHGEDKEEAYRILTLKMADGNQKAAEQMQKQAEAIQEKLDKNTESSSFHSAQLALIGFILGVGLYGKPSSEDVKDLSTKLGKILKSKGIDD